MIKLDKSHLHFGGVKLSISYNRLWRLLTDRDMQKKDLRIAAGLTTNAIAKLEKNENVSTEVLRKICKALDCDIINITEWVDDESNQANAEEKGR